MAAEYLYEKLPVFNGKEFFKFLKEAPEYVVGNNNSLLFKNLKF